VDADVSVALVVGEDEEDVRRLAAGLELRGGLGLRRRGGQEQEAEECGEGFHAGLRTRCFVQPFVLTVPRVAGF
jgi:hypothetical protein